MSYKAQLILLVVAACTAGRAQVAPAATGPGLPVPPGSLSYSIRYAQMAGFEGADAGDWQASTLSGSLNYSNGSQRRPFRLTYGGGYNWAISGPAFEPGFFQRLEITQGIAGRGWSASVSDDVGYSPQGPTSGFTGVPATGEPIAGQGTTVPTTESILTVNTHALNNSLSGAATKVMNASVLVSLGGTYGMFLFPDGNGMDTTTKSATGGLHWRLNARNSLTSDYSFGEFSYPDLRFAFRTESGLFGLQRTWNRNLTASAAVGPEWTTSTGSMVVPSSLGVSANATANYRFGLSAVGLAYSRGVSSGGGYLAGADVDTAGGTYSRSIGRVMDLGLNGSYSRSVELSQTGSVTARYGGAQVTRRLGRNLSVFLNYTAESQSASAALPSNTLNQLMQLVGFGIGYSSRELSFRGR